METCKRELFYFLRMIPLCLLSWASVSYFGAWWSMLAAFPIAVAVGVTEAVSNGIAKGVIEFSKRGR